MESAVTVSYCGREKKEGRASCPRGNERTNEGGRGGMCKRLHISPSTRIFPRGFFLFLSPLSLSPLSPWRARTIKADLSLSFFFITRARSLAYSRSFGSGALSLSFSLPLHLQAAPDPRDNRGCSGEERGQARNFSNKDRKERERE